MQSTLLQLDVQIEYPLQRLPILVVAQVFILKQLKELCSLFPEDHLLSVIACQLGVQSFLLIRIESTGADHVGYALLTYLLRLRDDIC